MLNICVTVISSVFCTKT